MRATLLCCRAVYVPQLTSSSLPCFAGPDIGSSLLSNAGTMLHITQLPYTSR